MQSHVSFVKHGAGIYREIELDFEVEKDGSKYAAFYLANESATDVYFDDLTVEHTRLIWQENAYYPFGMGIKPLDYEPEGASRWKYNGGSEREEAMGFDETPFRIGYDSQLGRFHQTDLLSEAFSNITSYQYGFNNPIMLNDPTGLKPNYKYDYDDGKYYKEKKNGKRKEVSYETATANLSGKKITNPDMIAGFMGAVGADSSVPHFFESEAEGIGFMLGISFNDDKPDKDGAVESVETSAWMLINGDEEMLAVMPWNKNNHGESHNDYFSLYYGNTKDDIKVFIFQKLKEYTVIGHIHTHPNYYNTYQGPTLKGEDGYLGDFNMDIYPIPKYVIGRYQVSRFIFDNPATDSRWDWDERTQQYTNNYYLTSTKNVYNGQCPFSKMLGLFLVISLFITSCDSKKVFLSEISDESILKCITDFQSSNDKDGIIQVTIRSTNQTPNNVGRDWNRTPSFVSQVDGQYVVVFTDVEHFMK